MPQPCSSKVGTSPSSPRPPPAEDMLGQTSHPLILLQREEFGCNNRFSYLGGEFYLGKAGDVIVHMAIVFLHLEVDLKSSMYFFLAQNMWCGNYPEVWLEVFAGWQNIPSLKKVLLQIHCFVHLERIPFALQFCRLLENNSIPPSPCLLFLLLHK